MVKTETLRMTSWMIIMEHSGWSVSWLKARNRKEYLTGGKDNGVIFERMEPGYL